MIPTQLSSTSHAMQNSQTLQRFLSPLYLWSQYGPLFSLKIGKSCIGWRSVAQVHQMWMILWQFQGYVLFSCLFIVSNLWIKMCDMMGLSYGSVKGLNTIIDTKFPGRLPFQCKVVNIGGECLKFHFRDVIGCIRSIYSDPQFMHSLAFAPE